MEQGASVFSRGLHTRKGFGEPPRIVLIQRAREREEKKEKDTTKAHATAVTIS